MMAVLPYFTVTCAVVCCGMARLKGGADHFWRGEGNYMSSQRDKQWWSDISASLTSAVPGDLLFTPRSRGASSQSGNVELKGSWWLSLELQKCNLSRCGRPVEHQSRPPFDPQPAWQSGVGTTLPSQPPGHLHYYKHGLTFLEVRQPDKHQDLWNENPR